MRSRSPRSVAAVLCVAGLGLAATACGGSHGPGPSSSRAVYRYTCCAASVVNRVHRPGEMFRVRWSAAAVAPQARSTGPVTLTLRLTGPFSSIAALKRNPTGASMTVRASPVHTSDRAGGSPLSTLRLPRAAKPGFYDLTSAVHQGGGVVSGDSIIRVAAR